jgi:hypothetical protein
VQGSTPSFKRLSSKLTTEALRQHGAYAEFWGYNHVLWEATANANILGRYASSLSNGILLLGEVACGRDA